jgi:hypothetical protein
MTERCGLRSGPLAEHTVIYANASSEPARRGGRRRENREEEERKEMGEMSWF